MIDVEWGLAPEGAETLREVKEFGYLRWFNREDQAWYGKEWDFPVDGYNIIATRPTQTKTVADAVEQEGEKWTHTRELDNERCYLLSEKADKDGHLPVFVENVGYDVEFGFKLKPIKTKISKAEAWDMLKDLPANEWSIHSHMMELENKYNII